jgi:ribosomal-protein-alanine N-acetyltransferase
MSMRLAVPTDAAALAALHAAAFPPMDRWGPDALALLLDVPRGFGLLAEGEGFILARLAADEAEILTLAVDPAARRRGVGGALLAGAMARAAAGGAASMFLEVAEGNAAARALYAAAGFAPVGRRRRYYPDGGDALVLRRSLLR